MKKSLALAVLFALGLASFNQGTFGHGSSVKITSSEARDATRLAREFSRQLAASKDITPLLDLFFVKDFPQGYLDTATRDNSPFILLDPLVARTIGPRQLRRYVIAEVNWLYLCNLYVFSRYSSLSDLDEKSPEDFYPADVIGLLRSDPRTDILLGGENSNESGPWIQTTGHFKKYLPVLEAATSLLRKHAKSIRAGRTTQYRETIADWSVRYSYYDPWLSVCNELCLGS